MKIKKALALTAALTIMLSAVSCGSSDSAKKNSKKESEQKVSEIPKLDKVTGLTEVGTVTTDFENIICVANDKIYTSDEYKGFRVDTVLPMKYTFSTETDRNIVLYNIETGTAVEIQDTKDVQYATIDDSKSILICETENQIRGYTVDTGKEMWSTDLPSTGTAFVNEFIKTFDDDNYLVKYAISDSDYNFLLINKNTGKQESLPEFDSLSDVTGSYMKKCGDKYVLGSTVVDSNGNIIFSGNDSEYIGKYETFDLTALSNGYFALVCKYTHTKVGGGETEDTTYQFFDNDFNTLTDRIEVSSDDVGGSYSQNIITVGEKTYYAIYHSGTNTTSTGNFIFDSDLNLYPNCIIDSSSKFMYSSNNNKVYNMATGKSAEIGTIGIVGSTARDMATDKSVYGDIVYVDDSTDYGSLYDSDLNNVYQLHGRLHVWNTDEDSDYIVCQENVTKALVDPTSYDITLINKKTHESKLLFDGLESRANGTQGINEADNGRLIGNTVIWQQWTNSFKEFTIESYDIDTDTTSTIYSFEDGYFQLLNEADDVVRYGVHVTEDENDNEVCTVYKFVDES
jgi:hypothetical protein